MISALLSRWPRNERSDKFQKSEILILNVDSIKKYQAVLQWHSVFLEEWGRERSREKWNINVPETPQCHRVIHQLH